MSTLVGHLCNLPENGRKEIEEEMKEKDREERGTGMKVKNNRRNRNIHPLPLPKCKPISVGHPGDVRYTKPDHPC